jgi:hypothetical protein
LLAGATAGAASVAGAATGAGAGTASATGAATGAGAASAAGADSVVAVFVSAASSVLLQPANNANDTSPVAIMSFDFIMLPYFYYNFD